MKPVFLSYFLNESTPSYGDEKNVFSHQFVSSIKHGDHTNNSKVHFNTHLGTHIDFPLHFYENGKSINDYNASFWIFSNIGIIECKPENILLKIENIDPEIDFLILKTGFSKYRGTERYWKSQPVIDSSIASILKAKFPKLRIFGFDLISLTSKLDRVDGRLAHLAFLESPEILILEDMNLANLDFRPTKIIVSPLLIRNIEGTPCTVIAF